MPLTPSPHLGLTRPDGTDAFLRTDWVDDIDLLDEYPGAFICTSVTRPSWGGSQTGMFISETDTGRIVRWDGSAWKVVETYPRVYRSSVTLNADLSGGAQATYTVDTVTTPRPCTLNIFLVAKIRKASVSPQLVTFTAWCEGSDASYGYPDVIQFPDGPSGSTKNYQHLVPILGARTVSSLGSTTHTVALRVNVDNAVANLITMLGVKSMVTLSEA